ncbi:MAG TPA: hypothetical protein VHE11_02170 [Steroidobacteraceae bacterium]|nr:hypothetical protein [Steroidobacteraceae bacterium]
MSGEHDRGKRKHGFCAVPANPKCSDCPEPKTYIEVCKPDGWFEHTFKRIVRARTGTTSFEKKYEAHHLVCVSPCSVELVAKKEIEGVVAQTVWCINNGKNMIAMPLWGHTVMWYCEITAAGGSIKDHATAPEFANIPQHDWDHNCKEGYTWEVEEACKKLAKKIEESGHKLKGEDLKGALEALSGKFRNILLNVRGTRCGGTHAAWAKGEEDPQSDWCQPFSMASTVKLTRKGFPVRKFDERVAAWIKRIAEAIAAGE